MTRREIRENVFRMLFRLEFHDQAEFEEQLGFFDEELQAEFGYSDEKQPEISGEDLAYINEKCSAVKEHLSELDAAINEKSKGWKTSRMGKADVSIIRLAVYEMMYEEDIPVKVSINEAVELAKKYGTDDSSSFVNGILAKFV